MASLAHASRTCLLGASSCSRPAAPAACSTSRPAVHAAPRATAAAGGGRRRAACSVSAASRSELLKELEVAIKLEDYSAAAALKQQVTELEAKDPVLNLQNQLKAAITEERYEDAARLQAQLKEQAESSSSESSLEVLPTMSDTVTEGIRVRVRSFYQPSASMPHRGHFIFGYHVTITNESERVVMLRNRYWHIVDASGKQEEVRGPGVIGQQPVMPPGKVFEYSSACPLSTKTGFQEGFFSFAILDEKDGQFSKELLEVKVGRFKLSMAEDSQGE